MSEKHKFDWISRITSDIIYKISFEDKFQILYFILIEESIYFSGTGIPMSCFNKINDVYTNIRKFITVKFNKNIDDRQNVFFIFGKINKHLLLINKRYLKYTNYKYIEKKAMEKLDKDYEAKIDAIKDGRYNFTTKEITPEPEYKKYTFNNTMHKTFNNNYMRYPASQYEA